MKKHFCTYWLLPLVLISIFTTSDVAFAQTTGFGAQFIANKLFGKKVESPESKSSEEKTEESKENTIKEPKKTSKQHYVQHYLRMALNPIFGVPYSYSFPRHHSRPNTDFFGDKISLTQEIEKTISDESGEMGSLENNICEDTENTCDFDPVEMEQHIGESGGMSSDEGENKSIGESGGMSSDVKAGRGESNELTDELQGSNTHNKGRRKRRFKSPNRIQSEYRCEDLTDPTCDHPDAPSSKAPKTCDKTNTCDETNICDEFNSCDDTEKLIGESGGMSSDEDKTKSIGESGGMTSDDYKVATRIHSGMSYDGYKNIDAIPNYYPTDLEINFILKGLSPFNVSADEIFQNPDFLDFRDDLNKSGFYFDENEIQIKYSSSNKRKKPKDNSAMSRNDYYPMVDVELKVIISDQEVRWIKTTKSSLEAIECENDTLAIYTIENIIEVINKYKTSISSHGDKYSSCGSASNTHMNFVKTPYKNFLPYPADRYY